MLIINENYFFVNYKYDKLFTKQKLSPMNIEESLD